MTPETFLRAVWPDVGYYALATPFKPPGSKVTVYAHKVFETIDGAVRFAVDRRRQQDIYFAIHSLAEKRVWNPLKVDYKTGELGAWEIRTQPNMRASKCFYLDLDVGVSTPRVKKYSSQVEALDALKHFCRETSLPRPLIVSSGGGLHVYWVLDEALPSQEWRQHALQLKGLVKHHGLHADPARTGDSASVLRVAGTFHLKDPTNPRPVAALSANQPTPTLQFLKLLADAVIRSGITVQPPPPIASDDDLGSNLAVEFSGPPVTMKALILACPQVARLAQLKGDVSEPEWYHSLNLVRYTENGRANAHKISAGHPDYSYDATERKLAQLEMKGIKPASCAKLAEVCGEDACRGCQFVGKVKTPLSAACFKDPAPPPVIAQLAGPPLTIPNPPSPYVRSKDGRILAKSQMADGSDEIVEVLPYDLAPVRRVVNNAAETEQQVWQVMLPSPSGPQAREFTLDADALYDRKKFLTVVANHGVYPPHGRVQIVQDYMVAYIAELQKLIEAEAQCNHLGWTDNLSAFILPDKILYDTGVAKTSSLSLGARRASAQVHKSGTLARQIKLLRFYQHSGYVANQFYILASLAAPIFYATGHHGVILNAAGDPGASKSTSLYTAASLWGQPELYPINGTNNGATVRARNERVTTLANLPICVDEITHMPPKDVVDLAMSITQPGHRLRLEQSGVERAAGGGYKATIMLTNGNNSLQGVLSQDHTAATAGSMRVFEVAFRRTGLHAKHEADAYWHELKENFGWVGEEFIAYVIRNRAAVETRVRAKMRQIDEEANIQSAERFWSATVACVLVAGEIAHELGLIHYDIAYMHRWAVTRQIPYMRSTVVEAYTGGAPTSLLTDYLQLIHGDTLVIGTPFQGSVLTNVTFTPRGKMLAHYDQNERKLWVLRQAFRDHCSKLGANYFATIEGLSAGPRPVITDSRARKVLGAGTEHAKAQVWCLEVDMSHPDLCNVLDEPRPAPTPGGATLRVVK